MLGNRCHYMLEPFEQGGCRRLCRHMKWSANGRINDASRVPTGFVMDGTTQASHTSPGQGQGPD